MIRRTTLAKTAVYLAAAGAITASLTACGSSRPATHPGSAAPAVKGPATSAAPDSIATGTQLKALLPAGSDLASVVTVTGTADSGANWTAPDALPAPALLSADCNVVTRWAWTTRCRCSRRRAQRWCCSRLRGRRTARRARRTSTGPKGI